MCQLGVIVKEPLARRASYDDYDLCFENFNRKMGCVKSRKFNDYLKHRTIGIEGFNYL